MNEKEQMLTSILNCQRADLYSKDVVLTKTQQAQLDEMSRRRESGEPLQYILGNSNFMGIDLDVDARVLIPRPETELLVEEVIKCAQKQFPDRALRLLDLGSGSGNIAIVLAKHIKDSRVQAVDISKDAVALGQHNASKNNVRGQIEFLCQNMIAYLMDNDFSNQGFDIIVSNPPYIPATQMYLLPEDVKKEPHLALNGGLDGLYFHRHIIMLSHGLLADEGALFIEIGDGQAVDVEYIVKKFSQYTKVEFINDYRQTKRIAVIRK